MPLASDFFRTWRHQLSSDFAPPSGQPAAWGSPTGAAFQPGSEQHTITTGAKVHAVALNPDGSLLAAGSGADVLVYSTESWTQVKRFGRLIGEVHKLAFSPDGKNLVSSSASGLRAWSVDESILRGADEDTASTSAMAAALEEIREDVIPGYTSAYGSTPFLPSGATFLYVSHSGSKARTVEAISLPDRTSLFRLVGHTDLIMSVETSPSTPLICTASWDGTVRLWSSVDGAPSHVLRGPDHQIWCGSFSPDGALVASGAGNLVVWVWNVESGDVVRKLDGFFPDWIRSIAWNPVGGALAAGSSGGIVRVFQTVGWESVEKWKIDERDNKFAGGFIEMQRLRWSRDGTRLLFWGTDARVTVQDLARNVKWEFEAGPQAWQDGDALMSSDGTVVVCGGKDGFIRVWDI